ncbi:MAG TPA: hypothetical protein VER55_15855, partial [Ardenticatenaceae bacterium]|nr:hypothetical protein [Ardenticatenaceae bacterium]
MFLQDSAGRRVTLGRELARGGEAAVYLVDGRPELVAKVYTIPRPGYDGKLAWMRDHPPVDRRRSHGHASIAWPSDLLRDRAGTVAGYLMPFVTDAVPLLEVFNPRRRARTLPGFDWRYLHRAARNLAAALAALHDRGYVVGDLNESNILVTPAALVTLIDTDSFQVQEPRPTQIVVYPCPVGRWEYTPPELQGQAFRGVLRQPQHDCFGLAVLIFQLLMDGSHPFRSQWLGSGDPPALEEKIVQGWFPYAEPARGPVAPPANAPTLNVLHPGVVQLIQRCFVEGHRNPRHRPDPEDWERALEEAEQAIVQCQNAHLFSSHARACPRCGARAARGGRGHPVPTARVQGTGTQSAALTATTQLKPTVRPRLSLRAAPSRVAAAVGRRVREGAREKLARFRPLRLSWRARIGALLILGALGSALVPTARGVGGRFFGIAGGEPAPNLVRILAHEPTGVRGIAFSPDGHTVAFGVADGTIRLLRLSDETVPQTVAAHRGQVTSVAFAPDGNVLASGSWDATVRLRRPEGGALLQTLAGHTAPVWSVALSPDGSLLASASADRTLRLWRVADGA